jgi:septum formation topological specificity factor MinE
MQKQTLTPEKIDFTVGAVDLQDVNDKLKKLDKKAITVLEKLLDSEDDAVRIKAVTLFFGTKTEIAKQIAADQLQRMIAQVRMQPSPVMLSEDQVKKMPRIDFDNIQDVG